MKRSGRFKDYLSQKVEVELDYPTIAALREREQDRLARGCQSPSSANRSSKRGALLLEVCRRSGLEEGSREGDQAERGAGQAHACLSCLMETCGIAGI